MKTNKEKRTLSPSHGTNKTISAKARRLSSNMRAQQSSGLRADIRNVLAHSEQQLNVVGRKVESMTKRMEIKTIRELNTFEKKWDLAQLWLKDRLEQVRAAELKAESLIDTSKVQAHLAKMDVQDKVDGFKSQYKSVRFKLESLRDRTADETIHALESLSNACLELKNKLESDRSIAKG